MFAVTEYNCQMMKWSFHEQSDNYLKGRLTPSNSNPLFTLVTLATDFMPHLKISNPNSFSLYIQNTGCTKTRLLKWTLTNLSLWKSFSIYFSRIHGILFKKAKKKTQHFYDTELLCIQQFWIIFIHFPDSFLTLFISGT